MPANIYGNRFAERNGHAWWSHNTTRLEGEDHKATTAVRVAGVDYGVIKEPLYYKDPFTNEVVLSDHVAILRPPADGERSAARLAVMTDQYEPLQNMELAQILDPLTDDWPVETVGALGKGEVIFITLNAGGATIGGDDLQQYLFAYNAHDGSSALKINITPVRVVCQNTCITGLREATVTASINHTRRIRVEAQFAVDLVASIRRAQQTTLEGLDQLTKIRVSAEQVSRVAEVVYPDPTKTKKVQQHDAYEAGDLSEIGDEALARLVGAKVSFENARIRQLEKRMAVRERLEAFNYDRPNMANTAWAAYNAITEIECWGGNELDANRAKSVLVGERAKNMKTAFAELIALS